MSRINPKTSLFYDAFTELSGGGVDYLNGNVLDRIQKIINVEFSWDLQNASVVFDSATKTIVMQNQYDNRTFISQDFKTGDTFDVIGTSSNDGSYTIYDISDDGKTVTTVESLVDETNDNSSFFGTTPITEIDFYYNLVPNTSGTYFSSIVDPDSLQKFSISGISANLPSTAKNFAIGTKSYAWVTNKITDATLGTTNEVTIVGMGVVNYVQSFKIVHYFYVTPFYLNSLFQNFQDEVAPSWYLKGSSLKYVCKVDAKYISGSPLADLSVVDNGINGTGSWFNSAALGSRAEYSLTSIVYSDNATTDPLVKLDVSKDCKVIMTINSRSGRFASTGSDTNSTMFFLGFNVCPSDEAEYQDTETTMLENFFADNCVNFLGDAPLNGNQYGTGYQSITGCFATIVSANVMTVTFVFKAGTLLKAYWESKENNDRYYEIYLITQGVTFTTTKATDRMTLLCDFQSADYETKTTNLFRIDNTKVGAFKYPDISNQLCGSLEGFQGDPFYAKFPFFILQHLGTADVCTVQNITWQVVGKKSGMTDFVFEERIIGFSDAKKLLNVQQLDYSGDRGFVTYDGDPCNEVLVSRDSSNDTATESAFVATYGLILRYESWVNALQQFQFTGTEVAIPDISKDIKNISQDWTLYNNIEGWDLFLRFCIAIDSTVNNSRNIYEAFLPIKVYSDDQVIWSGASGSLTQVTKYYNQDETEEISSIVGDSGIILIRTTLTGNFPLATDEQYYGQMFSTNEGGNIFSRRLASSEIPSESDSPFSPTAADLTADFSWAFGNCRINIFTGVKIVLESYFDSSIYGTSAQNIDVRSRIGSYQTSTS